MKTNISLTALLTQYKNRLGFIRQLRKSRQWDALPEKNKSGLLLEIKTLIQLLRRFVSPAAFRKLAASAAMVTGFAFTSNAQSFGPAQMNPFGFTFSDTLVFPTMGDIDNDGDYDLFIGNQLGDIYYYPNTGTATAAVLGTPQVNPFGLTNVGGGYMTYPELVDLDNDSDLDMMVGDSYGDFHYFQNTGTAAAPAFGAAQYNPFGLLAVVYTADPSFADMDNDGDKDMLVGDYYGDNHYFENTGSASSPSFDAAIVNPFGLTQVNYNSSPAPVDLDNDGDLDILIGDYYGAFNYFQNTGTASAPAFAAAVNNPFGLTAVGYYYGLAFADMDNDGDKDLFVGESYGDLYYFENTSPSAVTDQQFLTTVRIYPVPANDVVTVELSQPINDLIVTIYDLAGRSLVTTAVQNSTRITLSVAHLSAGVYSVELKSDDKTSLMKFIKR